MSLSSGHANFVAGLRSSAPVRRTKNPLAERDANKENKSSNVGGKHSRSNSDIDVVKKVKTADNVSEVEKQIEKNPITLKRGLCNSPEQGKPLSKVQKQAYEEFDGMFLQEISSLLSRKITAAKFEFSGKIKEQGALIKDLKKGLHSLRQKQIEFVEAILSIEQQSGTELEEVRASVTSTQMTVEELSLKLSEEQSTHQGTMQALSEMKSEKEKLDISLAHINENLQNLQKEKESVDATLSTTSSTLSSTKHELESTLRDLQERSKELEATTKNFADTKAKLQEEMIEKQGQFNQEKMKLTMDLTKANHSLETVTAEKTDLSEKTTAANLEIVQLKGDLINMTSQSQGFERDTERLTEEVKNLNEKLAAKGTELMNALESFNRNQRFNEERIMSISEDKKQLESRVSQLHTELAESNGKVTDVTYTLSTTQEKLSSTQDKLESVTNDLTSKLEAKTEELNSAVQSHAVEKAEMQATATAAASAAQQAQKEMIERHETTMKDTRAEHESKFQAQQEKYESKVENLTASYETKMSDMQAAHKDETATLVASHNDMMTTLKEEHTTAVQKLEANHESVVAGLQETAANDKEAHEQEMAAQQAAFAEEREATATAHTKEKEATAAAHQQVVEANALELANTIAANKVTVEALESRIENMQEETQKAKEHAEAAQAKHTEEMSAMSAQLSEVTGKFDETTIQLEQFKKHAGVDSQKQLEDLVALSLEAETLRKQLGDKEHLVNTLTTTQTQLAGVKGQLFEAEKTRRELHNVIQELKGNVRVHCRVRPSITSMDGEAVATDKTISCKADNKALKIRDSESEKSHVFTFDHVWGGESTQEAVFTEVSQLVQSALDGYNICLFSYGQTGAGKTHTMQGSVAGEGRGIIPRSIEKIMQEVKRLEDADWKYELECTFVEIYNETVRDLLKEEVNDETLSIKHDASGNPYAAGANKIPINSSEDMAGVMNLAAKHRHVAHTLMNSRSSRSHSVFTLHIKGTNLVKKCALTGSLNLCDLAGSERLSKSGATGDRLKEAQAINKSLSCLADVFVSISKKASHVPYRNSKLTHLLQQSFSAKGKSMMFVNLSPAASSFGESVCSLRFAEKVNQTQLGRPTKTVKSVKSLEDDTSSTSSSTTATTKPSSTSTHSTRSSTFKRSASTTASKGTNKKAKK